VHQQHRGRVDPGWGVFAGRRAHAYPAATLVEVSRLATPEMQVEIETDAVIEG
jgi:enamine deaminase RidA (YjgF/YER057c/UK114 family)